MGSPAACVVKLRCRQQPQSVRVSDSVGKRRYPGEGNPV